MKGGPLREGRALLTAQASRACHVQLSPVDQHLDLLRSEPQLFGLGVT